MVNKKELIFIKFGGAAITFKSFPKQANTDVLDRLAKEIFSVYNSDKHEILIGHGGGNFAHPIAQMYKVKEGLKVCGLKGFYETRRAVSELNKIVIDYLVDNNLPTIPIQTSAITIMQNNSVKSIYDSAIKEVLNSNFIPVISGDVCVDLKKGCAIASTEMLFSFLAKKIKPQKIIIGTDVDGVFDSNRNLISEINKKNINEILKTIKEPESTDVTGGMKHKIEELYKMAKSKAHVQIINLLKEDNLKRAILGENIGTLIKN